MWVIVHRRTEDGYVGVLDSTPTSTDPARHRWFGGAVVVFAPEHVADISTPARDYVIRQYGETFFSCRGCQLRPLIGARLPPQRRTRGLDSPAGIWSESSGSQISQGAKLRSEAPCERTLRLKTPAA